MRQLLSWPLQHPILASVLFLLFGLPLTWFALLHLDRAAWEEQKAAWRAAGEALEWSDLLARCPQDADLARQNDFRSACERFAVATGDDIPNGYTLAHLVDGQPLPVAVTDWLSDPATRAAYADFASIMDSGPVYAGTAGFLPLLYPSRQPSLEELNSLPYASLLHQRNIDQWLALLSHQQPEALQRLRTHVESLNPCVSLIDAAIAGVAHRHLDQAHLAATLDGQLDEAGFAAWTSVDLSACFTGGLLGEIQLYDLVLGDATIGHPSAFTSSFYGSRRPDLGPIVFALWYGWRQSFAGIMLIEYQRAIASTLEARSPSPPPPPSSSYFAPFILDTISWMYETPIQLTASHALATCAARLVLDAQQGQPLPADDAAAQTRLGSLADLGFGLQLVYEQLSPSRFRLAVVSDGSADPGLSAQMTSLIGKPSRLQSASDPSPQWRRCFSDHQWNIEIELEPLPPAP
jgi:hypothetical protein